MQKTYFWHKKEDSWAILIGLGIVAAATILFLADAANVLHLFNMKVSGWSSAADLGPVLTKIALPALSIFTFLAVILTIGAATLGFLLQKFLKGFIFLYILDTGALGHCTWSEYLRESHAAGESALGADRRACNRELYRRAGVV